MFKTIRVKHLTSYRMKTGSNEVHTIPQNWLQICLRIVCFFVKLKSKKERGKALFFPLINPKWEQNTHTLYPSFGKNESSSSSERYLFLSSISLSQRYACICSGVIAICPGVGVCICMAAGPAGVTPLVPIIGVVPPIWLAGVSSHRERRLLPGVGVAPGVSAPVRSVLGVSAQPGVAWPGVSPLRRKAVHKQKFS